MKCRCKAKPAPKVTWYRGAEVVQPSAKISILEAAATGEEDIYELTLEIKVLSSAYDKRLKQTFNAASKWLEHSQDPSAPDGGTYRCHVANEFGESNANLNLNIEAEPELEGEGPTFVDKPRIVSENNGRLVIMDCKVRANPRPDVLWTRDGVIVQETSKCVMSIREKLDLYYIKLELIEPGLDDSGLYKCNIKNHLGELNANLTLNIESECGEIEQIIE